MFDRRMFKNFDMPMLIAVVLLNMIGLLMIYSATAKTMGNYYVNHQLIASFIGLFLFGVLILIDYDWIVKFNNLVFVIILISLFYLAFIKKGNGGANRWITVFGLRIQPAEYMKISIILLFSQILTIARRGTTSLLNFIVAFILTLVVMLFIAKQPDLGTALLFFAMFLLYLFIAGISIKDLIVLLVPLLIASPLLFYNLKPYQQKRILVFLDPWRDVQGAGYNIIQSIIAIGSGGFTGKGFLAGTQSQLNFLPAKHTDFIFSVFTEQFGLMGVFILFALYYFVLYRIYLVLREVEDSVNLYFIVSGIFVLLGLHIFVNIGMTVGLLPVTGLTLPFMSYGGSSLISFYIAIALVENIKMRKNLT